MYSCVWASTPAVTRTITPTVRPSSAATSARRPISWKESTMTRPTPSSTARSSSPRVLLLPWKPTRPIGNPARSATASSPPEQTSSESPSSASHRATVVQRNALPA